MNEDCVFLILKQLNYNDLLSTAQVNEDLSSLASSVFHHKYSHLQVVVRYDDEFPKNPKEASNDSGGKTNTGKIGRFFQRLFGIAPKKEEAKPVAHESDTSISITDYDSIVHTFKHFGSVIRRLKIFTLNELQNSNEEFMGHLISEYASESLTDVEFEFVNKKLLAHITAPLVNVETVRFFGVYLSAVPKGLRLNELFPTVRRLDLQSVDGDGMGYFNCHMPHLIHFSTREINLDSEASFTDFIMKNPQIKSIEVNDNYPKFIQMANAHLPQLDTLKLSDFKLSNGSVRFENVTTFVTNLQHGSLENLHFPRLQTLRIHYRSSRFVDYLKFLNEHNHLKHLHLKYHTLSEAEFHRLTDNLIHLTKVTLEIGFDGLAKQVFSSKVIVNFLKTHDKMTQLNVIKYPAEWNVAQLQEQLKPEWDTEISERELVFERKENIIY